MNATIYDVSKLSGVSTATISRTFSNPKVVREDTRRRVFEAAEVLHYSPNAIARAMARQRTDKIAFLICKKYASILDEFYAGICNGILQATNRSEYQLLVSTAEDWIAAAGTAKCKQVEGVILGGNAESELVSEFQSQNIAVVLVNNRMRGFDLPSVISDEYDSVKQVVEYLLSRGHRKIGMLAGRFSPYISSARYSAFLDVMKLYGIPIEARNIRMCDASLPGAIAAATELLDQKDPPTAVFGANDMIAVGVIKAALRLGMQVPGDVAVAGCDDSTVCTVTEPELTSIHINCRRMGELAVEKLTTLLDGGAADTGVTVVPTELRVRGST